MRKTMLTMLATLAVVLGVLIPPAAPAAQAAESFDAGDIIADQLFYNASAMTSAQIQTFLDRQVGRCASNDCVNVLKASVSSRPARVSDSTGNIVCKAFPGGTNLRISEIIYRAQVACGISAKVILVTLQKEQGLVTSTNPSAWNLDHAMGQACPDSAPCDPAYAGIGVQIITGTTQLKTYKAASFGRQPGTYKIQYSPTASCGTKTVTIRNYATAALYNYTPYTPNAAALRNLDGVGDKCSSYGNRNFWRDYTRWFGSTRKGTVSTVDTVAHVLALDSTGELWAYPGNGKGGWLPRVSLGSPWTDAKRLIAPGDLDGDGHRDLLTVDSAGAVTLHRGDGILGFTAGTKLAVNWSDALLVADAGDLSGDGIPDVVTTTADGKILLWRGTEAGEFRAPVAMGTAGWAAMTALVGAGDFDRDGKADLIARRKDGVLLLYRGNGRSGLLAGKQIGSGWGSLTALMVPGDFDSNGTRDILARTTTGDLRLYRGTGTGGVGSGVRVGTGWGGFVGLVGPGPAASSVRAPSAGVGDLNNDGLRDVVSLDAAGQLRLLPGAGAGRLHTPFDIAPTIPAGARVFPLGDFDRDGIPDLGMIDSAGVFWLLAGRGQSGYAAPRQLGTGWGSLSFVFGGIDFDHDGKVDVIARTTTGDLSLYRGDGAGGYVPGAIRIGVGWNAFTSIFTPGDFDGDGHPDILARLANGGGLLLYPSDGAGHFTAKRQVGWGWGGFTAVFSPGNMDLTGGPDVIARRSDGTLVLYKTNRTGGWTGTAELGSGGNATWID